MVAVGTGFLPAPRADPGVRLSRTGLLPKVERDRYSGLGSPCSSGPQAGDVGDMPCPALGPGHALPPTFPSAGPLPSTPSAAVRHGFVRVLHRYYEPVRLLACSPTDCAFGLLSRSGIASATADQTRSPRFRRDPFARDGVFDHGRASTPRIAAPHISPSATVTASASTDFGFSRLNSPPHAIAVYASRRSSPSATQHSLPSARYGLLGPDFHRLDRASFAWLTTVTVTPVIQGKDERRRVRRQERRIGDGSVR